ncbi:hypothetical protein GCM10022252_00710 [Streptosporangium oxazolinicum]|uniref:Integrase n=1 Tax=Streptosporangium oxazolinicum TaxID=909287 RepID=A0ABP8A7I3_9ACTN
MPGLIGDRLGAIADRRWVRCKLATNTIKAYRRQSAAYVAWLSKHAAAHYDAFADLVSCV